MTGKDDRGTELRELFFETAQEHLQALNDSALKLEKSPADPEVVRVIRRTVHTLKGDAAACGFRELSELAHEMEDALALESALAHSSLPDISFTAADLSADMLAAYRGGKKVPAGTSLRALIRKLDSAPAQKKAAHKSGRGKPTGGHWSEYEQLTIANALAKSRPVLHVTVTLDPQCSMPIAGRQLVHSALKQLGEVLAQYPPANSASVGRVVEFALATTKPASEVASKAKIPTVASKAKAEALQGPARTTKAAAEPTVSTLTTTKPPVPAPDRDSLDFPAAAGAPAVSHQPENILRVDAERIDNVLNLVGELIIGKSMLQQALNELVAVDAKHPARGKFFDAMGFQARVLGDLQRSVMKIRMVPVEQLFRRFPRVIRDVGRQCGKDVALMITGENTDLDKSILDTIAEPITHLVRNAVGHGIENASERAAAGKPEQGTIRLNAYHQANQVIVEVSDDGRGIDVDRVRTKAIDLGLISAIEASRLNETEILRFIFQPGFTTAQEVTEISGRGVGMDVVQSVLHRLKGTVDVDSRPGVGTTFRLRLPLTLAIIKALLFRVEQRLYAIPLNAVVEISRNLESEVHQVDQYEVLTLRNEVLPLVRLGRAAEIESASRKLFILVITVAERKFGLIVDSLDGEEELVIKALDGEAISTDLVSGASIMGDGRVVLILNLAAVIDHFARSRSADAHGQVSGLLLSRSDQAPSVRSAAGGQA
jgi:two-component system, chemotaxis family, sensor kinase CheA